MHAARYLTWALVVLGGVLAVTALVQAINNPDIEGTSRGEHYTCLAPWDTVLNDANNSPGGEPPPDDDEIAARCEAAGRARFGHAVGFGVGAVVLLGSAIVVGLIADRWDRGVST